MKRRTFLQIGALSAAGALVAGCQSRNEKLIPYLIPPDEGVTPGTATYYASSCRFCPAGCGILVRVSEGRAKKIEGNPDHPVNRGKLCARGQAVLQELYHPDRVRQPLKRSGPRGSGAYTPISWHEGLGLLTGQLKTLQREKSTDRLALVTPHLQGTMAELVSGFMRAFGSSRHLSLDFHGTDRLRAAARHSFGQANLPWYDLAETRYLLSFGADFVDCHLSPVQYGSAFGRMRQERDTVRGHFAYVGGRMSLTAASADRWLPARPGSEGVLALGLARLILAEALFDRTALANAGLQAETLLRELEGYDLAHVADRTGLARGTIAEVAREFATTRPALAMAGEGLALQSNGPDAIRAVNLLNLLAGSLNHPGGVYPAGGSPAGPTDSLAELFSFVAAMRADRIGVALIQGDPVHAIPPATGFQEALDRVPFIVSFSTLPDDTARLADLILPDHSALESWGDVIPLAGGRAAVLGLMQPVVTPLFDTRQTPDVLLAAAGELGGKTAAALPHRSYLEMVKDSVIRRVGRAAGQRGETLWVDLLRRGGYFTAEKTPDREYRWQHAVPLSGLAQPRFTGDENRFPLYLHVYPGSALYDGRGAPLPWLQQLPDPMTTVVWDSWVEINPATAAGLDISFGDLVEVSSPRGSLRLPAVTYPGIRPDLVAIPQGQGHRSAGRYTRARGVNPLELLTLTDGDQPRLVWNGTRVRVSRISAAGDLVTAGHPQGSYRSDLIGI